ncbi:ElyC/SanA/YdcF family protein [Ferrimonas marina]|uniref:Uncharacterized SAM-binding protein YcdF, DUF218 family n=1 Tax=Ferrimonas marina TaxID=299255 RepID=A0A1M5VFB5_9GAMM|nr:ElyC/SanA/YdcF family protein [Ferrimonas marina]SHH73926.1 Uncharacterized SAM-binding protein YcdF, DUF218 family [Ferrimonas marina]
MGFWLKKAITALLLPVPLACLLMLAGGLCWRRWPRLGRTLLLAGPVYLLLLSFSPLSTALANSLEQRYPVFDINQPVDYVLVLGSAHHSDPDRTAVQQLSAIGLKRLSEGVRIWQANPQATLVVSGYSGQDAVPHARILRQAAIELGVPAQQIVALEQARDTREEARATQLLVGDGQAALVTSATHMHRSMLSYQRMGMTPVAAPTDFIATPTHPWYLTAGNLWTSQRALHEYLGLLWLSLT